MSRVMPAITLYQPWATWIMRGWKTIETRTHYRFKGLKGKAILIHAGQKIDDSDYAIKNPYLSNEEIMRNPLEMANGYILGAAYVKDFSELSTKAHSWKALIDCENVQRWGLFLEHVEKFDNPIPCKGEMGIWYFDFDSKQKVKKPF